MKRRQPAAARAVTLLAAALALTLGADIYARKMEIVRTPEGHETVLEDSVSIIDGSTRILAGRARLNENIGRAVVADSVFIETPDALIWADSAVYLMNERVTHLYGDVVVRQDSVLISAPRLSYSAAAKSVVADSGLTVRGTVQGYELRGARGSYDLDRAVGVVDSEPRFVHSREDDSVTVVARAMTWFEDEGRALAVDRVRVAAGRATLECDTLTFFPGTDSGLAVGGPSVSDSLSRTAGDTIVINLGEGQLRRVAIAGRAAGRYETEGGDEISVSGRVIRMLFRDGELDRVLVEALTDGVLVRRGGING